MIELFKSVGDNASIGIIIDFSSVIETYFIGNAERIREYAHSGTVPKSVMKHSSNFGNLLKDCNRLMGVKRELNEIMELTHFLLRADICGSYGCIFAVNPMPYSG